MHVIQVLVTTAMGVLHPAQNIKKLK